MTEDARREEIAANLEAVEARIAAACRAAGRDRSELTVVAVTKTFPATDVVHSVDRKRLVDALDRAAGSAGRRLAALIQVDLSGAPGRGGAPPPDVPDLADVVAHSEHLDLAGVMAIAPLDADPAPAFAALAELATDVRRNHPAAQIVSAGMSGDLEAAIAHGATHLRLGTALLGSRPPGR